MPESSRNGTDGRKRRGWKEEITWTFEETSDDLNGVTERKILDEMKLYRAQRKKSPEISIVALPQKKRPKDIVDTPVLVADIAAFRNSGPQSLVSCARLLRDWVDNDTFTWLGNEESSMKMRRFSCAAGRTLAPSEQPSI